MRNQNVGSKAAVDGDAEVAMVRAQILFAADTRRANPAADPRIDGNAAADDRGVGVGADAFDHAGDLMTERERQGASGADVELLVAVEGEIAILQVQIGMAHTPQRSMRTSTSLPRGDGHSTTVSQSGCP